MEHLQNIYYSLAEIAYAIAKIDGKIQDEEKEMIHEIVDSEMKENNLFLENMEFVIRFIQKDDVPAEIVYQGAMDEIRKNRYYTFSIKGVYHYTLERPQDIRARERNMKKYWSDIL